MTTFKSASNGNRNGPPPAPAGDQATSGATTQHHQQLPYVCTGVQTRSRRLLIEQQQQQQQQHQPASTVGRIDGTRPSVAHKKEKEDLRRQSNRHRNKSTIRAMQLEIVPLSMATVLRSSIQAASSKVKILKSKRTRGPATIQSRRGGAVVAKEKDHGTTSASSVSRDSDTTDSVMDNVDESRTDPSTSRTSSGSSATAASDEGTDTTCASSDDDDGVVPMELAEVYNEDEYNFIKALSEDERERLLALEEQVRQYDRHDVPARFRILQNQHMDLKVKSTVIRKLNSLSGMEPGSGEYSKLQAHISALTRLPLGVYKHCSGAAQTGAAGAGVLRSVQQAMDDNLYGQAEIKRQFMLTIAKWMSNPTSHGMVLGIEGPPGVGKTTLVKDCLAKAIDLPCEFIPLGGANDAAFLDGHSLTYEGSTWGKIAEAVMSAQCLNPILCFDELDKVADNRKGSEIFNVLTHLTDVSQNDAFCDKYFADIPLDLSRCIMVFTYNDASKVPRVLKDRMVTLVAKPYSVPDKLEILKRHIIPKMEQLYGFSCGDVVLPDDVLRYAVSAADTEGMRAARRLVESVYSHLNLERLMAATDGTRPSTSLLVLPVTVTLDKFSACAKDILGSLEEDRNGGSGFHKVSHIYM